MMRNCSLVWTIIGADHQRKYTAEQGVNVKRCSGSNGSDIGSVLSEAHVRSEAQKRSI